MGDVEHPYRSKLKHGSFLLAYGHRGFFSGGGCVDIQFSCLGFFLYTSFSCILFGYTSLSRMFLVYII